MGTVFVLFHPHLDRDSNVVGHHVTDGALGFREAEN